MTLHHVVAVAVEGCLLLDVAIPIHVFDYHGQDRYRFTLAGCRRGPVRTSTGVVLQAEAGLEALTVADTIVVAGYDDVLEPPPEPLLAALRAAAARGTRLISICTGAFALAWAGLLDGRPATTHWRSAAQLAERFPAVSVDPNVLYVDDGDILTSAGVAAGLDLCLHVVRQDHGAAAAASIARWSVVAPHRDGGQAQFIERPIVRPDDGASLGATRTWALERLHERLGLACLAAHASVSPRTFSRRFRAETGTKPGPHPCSGCSASAWHARFSSSRTPTYRLVSSRTPVGSPTSQRSDGTSPGSPGPHPPPTAGPFDPHRRPPTPEWSDDPAGVRIRPGRAVGRDRSSRLPRPRVTLSELGGWLH
jgi:AraC family transcriptional activator FtrA